MSLSSLFGSRQLEIATSLRDPTVDDSNWLFYSNSRRWTAEKMRNIFSKVMSEQGLNLSVSQYRHVAIAFGRRILESKHWTLMQSILDEQAAHSSETSEMNYAISNLDVSCIGPVSMNQFFEASWAWHSLLKLTDCERLSSVSSPNNQPSTHEAFAPRNLSSSSIDSQVFKKQVSNMHRELQDLHRTMDVLVSRSMMTPVGNNYLSLKFDQWRVFHRRF